MANKFDVVIGIDPGVVGGISIVYKNGVIDINKMPVQSIVVNKKNKKVYDLEKIVGIFKSLVGKKVLFLQEKVSSHPGEGSVSAFNFGKSSGSTLGIAYGLGFKVTEVSSIKWKRHFPQLVTEEMLEKKEEIKKLRVLSKTLKDKTAKKLNKKEIDRLYRQVKSAAKTAARELVSKLYPKLADNFQKKNSDGVAESVLIALYGKDKQNELV